MKRRAEQLCSSAKLQGCRFHLGTFRVRRQCFFFFYPERTSAFESILRETKENKTKSSHPLLNEKNVFVIAKLRIEDEALQDSYRKPRTEDLFGDRNNQM